MKVLLSVFRFPKINSIPLIMAQRLARHLLNLPIALSTIIMRFAPIYIMWINGRVTLNLCVLISQPCATRWRSIRLCASVFILLIIWRPARMLMIGVLVWTFGMVNIVVALLKWWILLMSLLHIHLPSMRSCIWIMAASGTLRSGENFSSFILNAVSLELRATPIGIIP